MRHPLHTLVFLHHENSFPSSLFNDMIGTKNDPKLHHHESPPIDRLMIHFQQFSAFKPAATDIVGHISRPHHSAILAVFKLKINFLKMNIWIKICQFQYFDSLGDKREPIWILFLIVNQMVLGPPFTWWLPWPLEGKLLAVKWNWLELDIYSWDLQMNFEEAGAELGQTSAIFLNVV